MQILIPGVVGLAALALLLPGAPAQEQDEPPRPVRNDVPQFGTEILVLRHQRLLKSGHEAYFRLSREGVWPWFEKIGSRIVGQWQVVHPDGSAADPEYDHGYRLARYASYTHWQATRNGRQLGGNGPDYQRSRAALRARSHFVAGSDGAYFLEGVTAATTVYYMPGLDESYEAADEGEPVRALPVRNDRNWPAREIVALDRWKVAPGSADEFIRAGIRGMWPYLEKVGARIVGQWKAVYPPESGFPGNPDYDEVLGMVRYAGYEHWKAAQPDAIAAMGGDGRDYQAYRRALDVRGNLAQDRDRTFLEGYLYHSPPKFLPGLREAYRRAR